MDSLTQLVLGAAVAGSVTRQRRGLVYGAVLGTLPDLDVLLRFGDPIDRLTLHRTASHSLIVLSVITPLLLWLAIRFDRQLRADVQGSFVEGTWAHGSGYWRWFLAFWLALVTHPLLDYTTIYGTQLFWPLLKTPFGTGHMFIIDPLYTVPLIVGVLWHWRRNWWGSAISLALSSAYLLSGLWTQQIAYARALADLGPLRSDQKLLVVAAPLTILMHRAVLREKNGYREAYVSLVADQGALRWERFVSEDALIADLSNAPASAKSWQRLRDFSHGFVALERMTQNGESHVIASDLRMGSAPHFVFSYDFGPPSSPHSQVLEREAVRPDLETIKWVFNRILTPAEQLPLASQVYGAKAQN